ncbi:MAG: hypothetical protein OXH08_01885 [Gammaproteobacteria bacterium]|nr:hypothetical protein [Gammaproteobacteria bacterium]
MVRSSLLMALVILVSGCARWVPARVGDVPVGTDVRLRLSDEGAAQLEELTGTRRSEVAGQLLQWDSEVMVSAALQAAGAGANSSSLRQRFVVDQEDILGVDIRELDRTRTGLFVGGVAVVAGSAIVWVVSQLAGGGTAATNPPPSGPSEPFVRIRIP